MANTITTSGKSHYKTFNGKHDIIKHEGRDQTEKIEVEKPQLEKRYQEIIEKTKEKSRHKKSSSAIRKRRCRSTSKKMRMQQQKQKVKILEWNQKKSKERAQGTLMNDGVEMTGEAGGRHPGRHTVNEEACHIVFHTEHVEHDMNDDTGNRPKL